MKGNYPYTDPIRCSESMKAFRSFLQNELSLPTLGNRFLCMDKLEQIVKDKKGAYTEENRQSWLVSLYACLAAPEVSFSERKQKSHEKKGKQFRKKLNQLQRKLVLETERNSSLYTYIACIRDYLKKTTYCELTEHSHLTNNLYSHLHDILEYRLEESPWLEINKSKYRNSYNRALEKIFVTEGKKLRHPVFFLFLPYYVFFELAKCEQLLSKNNSKDDAFSVPQLNRKSLNWSVRSSPVKATSPEGIKKLLSLYTQVEQAICEVLSDQECHTIGQAAWNASYRYPKDLSLMDIFRIPSDNNDDESDDESDEESDDDEYDAEDNDEDGADDETGLDYWEDSLFIWNYPEKITWPFYVPIWKYNEWALCFQRIFQVNFVAIKKDMHKLFNLSFRPSTRQAANEATHICEKYKDKRIVSRKQPFCLSDILSALCTIYNLRYFCEPDLFASEELKHAVCFLYDFCIATSQLLDLETDNLEEKWVALLRYGYPEEEYIPFDTEDDFLINPNRILVKAILLRAIAQKWGGDIHQTSEIQNWFSIAVFYGDKGKYDTVMKVVQNEIYAAMTSPKRLLRDLATWGGVKIVNDRAVSSNAQYSLIDAIHIWEFWHETDSLVFSKIAMYIQKKPSCLDKVAENLGEPFSHPKKLDLDHLAYFELTDSMKTKRLASRKKTIVDLLPEQIQEELKEFGELDDFRYTILLYILFSAMRKRMCHQAYNLCMKFLRLT